MGASANYESAAELLHPRAGKQRARGGAAHSLFRRFREDRAASGFEPLPRLAHQRAFRVLF